MVQLWLSRRLLPQFCAVSIKIKGLLLEDSGFQCDWSVVGPQCWSVIIWVAVAEIRWVIFIRRGVLNGWLVFKSSYKLPNLLLNDFLPFKRRELVSWLLWTDNDFFDTGFNPFCTVTFICQLSVIEITCNKLLSMARPRCGSALSPEGGSVLVQWKNETFYSYLLKCSV